MGSGGWQWTNDITSWNSSSGHFERWYGHAGFTSRNGNAHLELDVDTEGSAGGQRNTTIWQMLNTQAGRTYNVFYSASHRANGNGVSKVGVLLDFDGNGAQPWSLEHDTGSDLTKHLTWVDFGFSFVATSNQTKIGFQAMGTENEYGDHLDNVGVTERSGTVLSVVRVSGSREGEQATRQRRALRWCV